MSLAEDLWNNAIDVAQDIVDRTQAKVEKIDGHLEQAKQALADAEAYLARLRESGPAAFTEPGENVEAHAEHASGKGTAH